MGLNKNDKDPQKVFTRRAFVIGGIQGALLAVMGGRLAWLQIAEGQKYQTLADRNRINIKLLAPSRGEIFDRYGVPLAVNTQNFRVLIIPEQTEDVKQSLQSLQGVIELDDKQLEHAVKTASKVAKFIPVEVAEDLSWEDVAKIEVNLPDLPGLFIDVGERRDYPQKNNTAHIIGYVGAVNENELNEDKLLKLPGFKVGKTGIEKTSDLSLRGAAGTSKIEVNVIGREVRELSKEEAHNGKPMILSVDSVLQDAVQKRLDQERSASAVIMDAYTGAIYAMASSPSFDPNMFTRALPADEWEALLANPGLPLNNKAVSGVYPPGSTFKMVSALAGLEAGVINKNSRVTCNGYMELGKDRFHCWKRGGHGSMNLVSSLEQSCDVYFYKMATEVGIDKIAEMARRLGLGKELGFDLSEERPGLIPDKDWKRGYFGKSWQPGETIVSSIGQGYTLTTPLQLAVMTARLVNGGLAVKPWMNVYDSDNHKKDQKTWADIGLSKDHLSLVKQGMDAVTSGRKGTAAGAQIRVAGMEMGGKTGTAQVRRITREQRATGVRNEDLPWKSRHHALFVGYAPIDNPRYVASVVIEHGVSGSGSAAPLARDILFEAQNRAPATKPPISIDSKLVSRKSTVLGSDNG